VLPPIDDTSHSSWATLPPSGVKYPSCDNLPSPPTPIESDPSIPFPDSYDGFNPNYGIQHPIAK
jgi:hypothetical protein